MSHILVIPNTSNISNVLDTPVDMECGEYIVLACVPQPAAPLRPLR